jgi:4'-phosphopantetheinyl transferase
MPLPLAQNVVEAWVVDLTGHDQVECAHAILSQDERARAARFHFAVDRNRFILARGALRQILASHEGVHPAEITFCYSEFGKPRLRMTHGDLRFNLSHSSDRAFVAGTRGREVALRGRRLCLLPAKTTRRNPSRALDIC